MEKLIELPESFAVEEAVNIRKQLYEDLEHGTVHFVIDFSGCTFIDSTGLGVLVSAYKRCMDNNGTFKLRSIRNSKVREIFKLTRLDKVFDIID